MFSLEGYQALRQGAGLVRRGDRGVLAVSGPDRLTWLQGLLTNDVAALPIGGVCDAAYLTPQGRMITDLRVLHLADRTLLDVPASLSENLRSKLEALLFAEDAQIADVTSSHLMLDVHGPAAPPIVAETISVHGPLIKASCADAPYGVPGFSVLVSPADADVLTAALVQRGAVQTTLETLDVLRIEAGRPAFLIDMDEHTLPLEAGLEERAISFTKGCYVGQEVIIRVMHRGHGRVAKKLVGLTLAKGELPKAGAQLVADSRDIGKLTSVVWSPLLETGIALGYVHRDFINHGTRVTVVATTGNLDATVTSLPFRTD
jgi:tRNA-modifying protein YgfZ